MTKQRESKSFVAGPVTITVTAEYLSEIVPDAKGITELLGYPLSPDRTLIDVLEAVRKAYFERALEESGGNKARAARILHVGVDYLKKRLQ